MTSPASAARARTAPGVVRRRAVLLPLAAAVAGYAATGSRRVANVASLAAATVPAGALLIARLGRPVPGSAHRAPGAVTAPDPAVVTLLIPARDEAPVIARLIADVAAARSGPIAVAVVDDASGDGTGDLAAAAITAHGLDGVASVVRLEAPSGSKAAALRAAPLQSGVVVVLDADARLTPGFVDRVRAAAGPEGVAQARRRMLRPTGRGLRPWWARALAFAQDGEQAVDDRIGRARLALGGAAEFRGNGMVIGTQVLESLGGWPADALCEDLELATRWYLRSGRGAARPVDLDVWEQPVLAVRSLWAQRLRWAEGAIRRDLRIVAPALVDTRVPARRRAEVAAYASQAVLPWAVIGIALRAFGPRVWPGRARGLHARPGEAAASASARGLLAALAVAYGSGAVILAWNALEHGLPAPGAAGPGPNRFAPVPRLVRALAVAAFTGLWPLVLPVAWLRVARDPGPPRFVQTPHVSPDAFSEPEPPLPPPT